jgi:hypothetical protein
LIVIFSVSPVFARSSCTLLVKICHPANIQMDGTWKINACLSRSCFVDENASFCSLPLVLLFYRERTMRFQRRGCRKSTVAPDAEPMTTGSTPAVRGAPLCPVALHIIRARKCSIATTPEQVQSLAGILREPVRARPDSNPWPGPAPGAQPPTNFGPVSRNMCGAKR